mmetsp:Transcript_30963/g.92105  ORF Transcript_30963/g.92105 Transcript_30963/m.92105 type:complete len:301 (+) Transcript_30963:233-1135(+)
MRGVAPLVESLTCTLHQKDSVPVLPSVCESVPDDSQRDRHVKHGHDDQDPDDEAALRALRIHITVAHSGHGHEREPECVGQRDDVGAWLYEVNQNCEHHRNDHQDVNQHRQRFSRKIEGLDQQVELLKATQYLQKSEDGNAAQKDAVGDVLHLRSRENESVPYPHHQGHGNKHVYPVEDAQEPDRFARTTNIAQDELRQEKHVNHRLNHRWTNSVDWRSWDGLRNRHECREHDVASVELRKASRSPTRLRIFHEVPDPSPEARLPVPLGEQRAGPFELRLVEDRVPEFARGVGGLLGLVV